MNFNKKKELQLKMIMLVSLFEFVPKTSNTTRQIIHSFIYSLKIFFLNLSERLHLTMVLSGEKPNTPQRILSLLSQLVHCNSG